MAPVKQIVLPWNAVMMVAVVPVAFAENRPSASMDSACVSQIATTKTVVMMVAGAFAEAARGEMSA